MDLGWETWIKPVLMATLALSAIGLVLVRLIARRGLALQQFVCSGLLVLYALVPAVVFVPPLRPEFRQRMP